MLNDATAAQEVTAVSASLAKSWKFLSGEDRAFSPVEALIPPQYEQHCYFLKADIQDAGKHCAVGILLQRSDAISVASYMFGTEPADVSEDDLDDACSEVCNVLGGGTLLLLSGKSEISLGVPTHLGERGYLTTNDGSHLAAAYKSTVNEKTLYVLLYSPAQLEGESP